MKRLLLPATSVDVPLEVIAAVGKRQVVEVRGRRPSHRVKAVLYALRSDRVVFQLLQGISCLPPLDPPLTSVVDADLSMA